MLPKLKGILAVIVFWVSLILLIMHPAVAAILAITMGVCLLSGVIYIAFADM